MPTLEDQLADLRLGRGDPARESFFGLARRGQAGAAALAALLAEPAARDNVTAIVTSAGPRVLVAYAGASSALRAVLRPLLAGLAPEVLLSAAWAAMDHGSMAGSARTETASAVTELVEECAAGAASGSRTFVASGVVLGRAYLAAGSAPTALERFLAAVKSSSAEFAALPPRFRAAAAAGIGEAVAATADWPAAFAAAEGLVEAGMVAAAAGLLVQGLLAMPRGAVPLVANVLASASAAGRLPGLVQQAWDAASGGLAVRRRARSGYFAEQLALVKGIVGQVQELLADPLREFAAGPSVGQLAGRAAGKVERLMEELVAFQPARPEAVQPRQIVLAIVLACRDELGAAGVQLRAAPAGGSAAESTAGAQLPVLDPSLVRGLLRGLLRNLAGDATPRDGEVELGAEEEAAGEQPPVVRFSVAMRGTAAAGRLLAACDGSTVPDLLRRCRTEVSLVNEAGDDNDAVLWLRLPGWDPGAAGQAVPRANPAELRVALLGAAKEPAAPERLAHDLATGVEILVAGEIEQWGRDLGLVLHDLKNSLAFLQAWVRDDGVWDQETVRLRCQDNIDDLQFWLSQADAMLGRPDDGGQSYVDVAEMTGRVLRGSAAVMADHRQRLVLEVGERLPKVPASPFAVASVIRNLVRNALHATPDGSSLAVRVNHQASAESVVVEVKDAGSGFPGLLLAGGEQTQAGHTDGLSAPHLGLVSVRRLLAEQGGMLELSNDPQAGGGIARAYFSTGAGVSGLGAGLSGWAAVTPDSRRALRAAHALAAAGDPATAAHVWGVALQLEVTALLAGISAPMLLPRLAAVTAGSGARPQLTAAARAALSSTFGEGAYPRAEAAARRVIGRITDRKLQAGDLDLVETAVAIVLFGLPSSAGGAQAGGRAPHFEQATGEGVAVARELFRISAQLGKTEAQVWPAGQEVVALVAALAALRQDRDMGG